MDIEITIKRESLKLDTPLEIYVGKDVAKELMPKLVKLEQTTRARALGITLPILINAAKSFTAYSDKITANEICIGLNTMIICGARAKTLHEIAAICGSESFFSYDDMIKFLRYEDE